MDLIVRCKDAKPVTVRGVFRIEEHHNGIAVHFFDGRSLEPSLKFYYYASGPMLTVYKGGKNDKA